MRSYIVRVYRCQRSGEFTGTVQAVGQAAQPASAFTSGAELLQQMAQRNRPCNQGGVKPLPAPAPDASAGHAGNAPGPPAG